MVPGPVSDRRVAMARMAIIVTVTAWLAYLVTWFFEDFFHPGYENAVARAEAVLYLLIVTMLTVSALAYLLSPARLLLPDPHASPGRPRHPRPVLRHDDADADNDHPVLPGGRARHPQHPAVRGSPGIPGEARRPADRRPVRPEDQEGPRPARRGQGAAAPDRAAAGRARGQVRPRAAGVRACLRASRAARRRLDDRARQLLRRRGHLAGVAGRRPAGHRPHRRVLRQRSDLAARGVAA